MHTSFIVTWKLDIIDPCQVATFPQSGLTFKLNVGVGQARDEIFNSEYSCGSINSKLDCECG
jgi:hypothetical protein